MDNAMTRKKP